ncbi:mechanosensitive ion channel family protein [Actinotalea sp. M2MS4P-6]|uniref:mechanosensitive ion channel family protein n=1 Tax=Actinotalea sp. M2MS4P-6 TaxID=2983762 RepID=UPI0021E4535E|nr:mechanosensitive ion channel family protein [Actinotalea sp. M2MS4P-6]MCV2396218.1 mechanosensitive ion channel family protein [Actinotalea sp. M2MS4P-6]
MLATGYPAAPAVLAVSADTMPAWLEWLLGPPLSTAITIAIGALVLVILRRIIGRTVRSVIEGGTQVRAHARRLMLRSGMEIPEDDVLAEARRAQRVQTMGSVLRSAAALLVGIVVITVLANIWGWDLGPLLASAGVVGVALGFGAQTLVKDFLSGLFMLVEDQYGVGDVVDLGEASGVVESIGLRVTQVRDLQGTLWYVRNGEVLRVGNQSQGWSRAFVEVLVTPEQDVTAAVDQLRSAAAAVADDPDIAPLLLDEPGVTAYEDLSAEAVRLRVMIKTVPGKQWDVQRALRSRIRDTFARAGVALALPHREVQVRNRAAAQDQNSNG